MPDWYVFFWVPSLVYRFLAHTQHLAAPAWASLVEAAGFVLFAALAVIWKVSETLALRQTRADRAFSERLAGIVEYPVEIIVKIDGVELGTDRGIVWFEDGLLHFNGAATSFALTHVDFIAVPAHEHQPFAGWRPRRALWLRMERRRAHVRFLPLGSFRCLAFDLAFWRFRRAREMTDEPRQWPPLTPYGPLPATPGCLDSPEAIGAEAARTASATGVVQVRR